MPKRKSPPPPKYWMPVSGSGRTGQYEVSDGWMTVVYRSKTIRAVASSAHIPVAHLGADADRGLAEQLLGEFSDD
jgi:hypothetical protein